jgi:hypothetical protein
VMANVATSSYIVVFVCSCARCSVLLEPKAAAGVSLSLREGIMLEQRNPDV